MTRAFRHAGAALFALSFVFGCTMEAAPHGDASSADETATDPNVCCLSRGQKWDARKEKFRDATKFEVAAKSACATRPFGKALPLADCEETCCEYGPTRHDRLAPAACQWQFAGDGFDAARGTPVAREVCDAALTKVCCDVSGRNTMPYRSDLTRDECTRSGKEVDVGACYAFFAPVCCDLRDTAGYLENSFGWRCERGRGKTLHDGECTPEELVPYAWVCCERARTEQVEGQDVTFRERTNVRRRECRADADEITVRDEPCDETDGLFNEEQRQSVGLDP
jgi:hypothetical protein